MAPSLSTANNLIAGTYSVAVIDANGWIRFLIVTITEPAALIAAVVG